MLWYWLTCFCLPTLIVDTVATITRCTNCGMMCLQTLELAANRIRTLEGLEHHYCLVSLDLEENQVTFKHFLLSVLLIKIREKCIKQGKVHLKGPNLTDSCEILKFHIFMRFCGNKIVEVSTIAAENSFLIEFSVL
jgi:hypothetical protein